MADKKISQLTALSAANLAPSTDVLAIVDTSATETKKIAAQDIVNGVLNVASAVGIGTASPSDILTLAGGASGSYGLTINNAKVGGGTKAIFQYDATNAIALVGGNTTNGLAFQTLTGGSLTTKATLDSSGNLGLGVTPNAWNAVYRAMNIGSRGFIFSRTDNQETSIGVNWYRTTAAAFVYAQNGYATSYTQLDGVHGWYNSTNNTSGADAPYTPIQAMTLDASGRLLVGTTTASGNAGLQIKGASSGYARIEGTSSTLFAGNAGDLISGAAAADSAVRAEGALLFATGGGTERARITAGGYFKASNAGTYIDSTGTYHEFRSDITVANAVLFANATSTSVTSDGIIQSRASRDTTNNTFYYFSCYNTVAAAYKLRIADSGNVTNTNGSYGTISDAKMKTDIVDAGSQWDDLKAVRFRKFKMKDDPSGLMQLGVVAQELEQTSPGLVDEHADRDAEGNDLGTTTKSVKTSILLMKAAKALQEAMARIEQLEADMAALKASA